MSNIIPTKDWLTVGYRLKGDSEWMPKCPKVMTPDEAHQDHALGRIHLRTRPDGKLETLQVKGRR